MHALKKNSRFKLITLKKSECKLRSGADETCSTCNREEQIRIAMYIGKSFSVCGYVASSDICSRCCKNGDVLRSGSVHLSVGKNYVALDHSIECIPDFTDFL